MKRNHNLRIIKEKKSYSTKELAETLDIHLQTVRSWHRNGLKTIDPASHYSLFLGSDVKKHLRQLMESRRTKLQLDEFYCFMCRQKTTSRKTHVVAQNRTVGRGKPLVRLTGHCVKCGRQVNKFSTKQANRADTPVVIKSGPEASLYQSQISKTK